MLSSSGVRSPTADNDRPTFSIAVEVNDSWMPPAANANAYAGARINGGVVVAVAAVVAVAVAVVAAVVAVVAVVVAVVAVVAVVVVAVVAVVVLGSAGATFDPWPAASDVFGALTGADSGRRFSTC